MVFCVCLLLLGVMVLRFLHVVVCTGSLFLFLAGYSSIAWIYHLLFIHSLVDGHLYCSQFGAIVNYVVIYIHILVFVWAYVFISLRLELFGKCMFNILRKCWTVFQSGWTISYSYQQCMRVLVHNILVSTCYRLSIDCNYSDGCVVVAHCDVK